MSTAEALIGLAASFACLLGVVAWSTRSELGPRPVILRLSDLRTSTRLMLVLVLPPLGLLVLLAGPVVVAALRDGRLGAIHG